MNSALLLVFTLFSLIAFSGILWGADPYTSGGLIKILFFITLFFTASGLFTFCGVFGSRLIGKPIALGSALRKGLLLALLAVTLVALEAGAILNIGNAFAVFMLAVALEMLAIARSMRYGKRNNKK